MAELAAHYSDAVILTSDNPRFEDPEDILDQMEAGVPKEMAYKVARISDRKLAILTAVKEFAKAGDVILVAGKGHETYQEIKGVKYDFDDKSVLALAFGS
jgi:UDP-N-acetylmuramoyl-L-alanyl-D-glutamate--2,6-diaminopimelate ligase